MNSSSNEDQIRLLVDNWAQAVRDGDMEAVLKRHMDNIVMFDVMPPLQFNGMKEYKETWELFFQYSPGGEGSFELVDLNITAGSEIAFGHALLKIGGSKIPQCRLTLGFQKIDGAWFIAHEHHSAPSTN